MSSYPYAGGSPPLGQPGRAPAAPHEAVELDILSSAGSSSVSSPPTLRPFTDLTEDKEERYTDDVDGGTGAHDEGGDDDGEAAGRRGGYLLPAWKASGETPPRRTSLARRIAQRARQRGFTTLVYALTALVVLNMLFGTGDNVAIGIGRFLKRLVGLGPRWPDGDSSWALAPWVKEPTRPDLRYDSPFNRDDLTLTEGQCNAFFPKLYKDLERSRVYYSTFGQRYTRDYLELACGDDRYSQLRVVIYHNRLYVKMYKQSDQSRTQSTLALLSQAITSSRERLPNVEFCLDLQDWGAPGQFSLSRHSSQEDVWLMPDYAFYAWPEHIGGSYKEFREKSAELEEKVGWENKTAQLLWRGSIKVGTEDRQAMLDSTKGYNWSAAEILDWTGDRKNWLSMLDHCKRKFQGYSEGNTYSGRLRYLQNCRTVIITHRPHWIQHWTHLFNADPRSPDQNIVFVPLESDDKRDEWRAKSSAPWEYLKTWARLPEVMDQLLRDDERAKRIADNQWTFFRERYVSPASAACYWRQALRTFASIQHYDVDLTGREISYEDHMIAGFPAWPPSHE